MSDSEMVERAARAIQKEAPLCERYDWSQVVTAARAVIEAMREPDAAMLEAAREMDMLSSCDGDPTASYPDDAGIWRAMIDEALRTESA